MAFTQITLTGTLSRPDGTSSEGTFTATLSGTMTNGSTVVEPVPLAGILTSSGPTDQAGQPFTLDAVDDTGTEPTDRFYTFVIEADDAPIDPFTAVISHLAPGGTVDLSTLIPETP